MMAARADYHEGVSCDGCSQTAFKGMRYKCLRCNDYDLCHMCFRDKNFGEQNATEVSAHDDTHPMQMIMTPLDFVTCYEGDPSRNYDTCKIVSFTCPYCHMNGFNQRGFGAHVTTVHHDPPSYNVICPVCISNPETEHSSTRDTENLRAHWNENHANHNDSYRNEPSRAAANRRPMLARRTVRQVGQQAQQPRPQMTPVWPMDTDMDMNEFLRTMRDSLTAGGTGTALEMQRPAFIQQHIMRSNARNIEQQAAAAAAAAASAAATMPTGPPVISHGNMIRPLRSTPVYQQTSDFGEAAHFLDDFTEDDFTSDDQAILPAIRPGESGSQEGGAQFSIGEEQGNSNQKSTCRQTHLCDSDSEYELHMASDGDISSEDEILDDRGFRQKPFGNPDKHPERDEIWKELREKLTADEIEIVLGALKAEPGFELDDRGDIEETDVNGGVMGPVMGPTGLIGPGGPGVIGPGAGATATPIEAGPRLLANGTWVLPPYPGEPNWLPLRFDGPPLATYGCGQYWRDKRFLRQRKFHRDQSMASTQKEDIDKANVALAICRATCHGINEPEGREVKIRAYDRPDRAIRRAMRHLNLGAASDENGEKLLNISQIVEVEENVRNEQATNEPVILFDESDFLDNITLSNGILEAPSSTLQDIPENPEEAENLEEEEAEESHNESSIQAPVEIIIEHSSSESGDETEVYEEEVEEAVDDIDDDEDLLSTST
ncbi:unnamed protein product [Caenorhabditis angaria]|uniref:RING-type E3 ubiquitin transferase n=1 Tax=Caenorhabditis angaria TaxID=860376 RepID=A0A9P1IJE2_9PELO|nr:unnamed protein product [Caenorhabditis angaria]